MDATIVRAVLLPATMKLLGKWNWYLPKKLHWLPEFRHEPLPEPARPSAQRNTRGNERRPREIRGGRRVAVKGRVDGDGGDRHQADEQAGAVGAEALDGAEPDHERERGGDDREVGDRGGLFGGRGRDVAGEQRELDAWRASAAQAATRIGPRRGSSGAASSVKPTSASERGRRPARGRARVRRGSTPLTIAAPATTSRGGAEHGPAARARRRARGTPATAPTITPALVAPI